MDAGHIWDRAPAIFASGARPTTLARLSQAGNQLAAQRAARHRVKRGIPQGDFLRGVDGLVADLKVGLVRVHSLQYARDLFRRMAGAQQAFDMPPERAVLGEPRGASCGSRQRTGALLRDWGTIATRDRRTPAFLWRRGWIVPPVTVQFTTDRTRRALHAAGNCPQRAALLKSQLDHRALFTTQMLVVRSHRNTLPSGKCCTSDLSPPCYCVIYGSMNCIFMSLLSGDVRGDEF